MSETVIKIENLKKQYRLGLIGGGTLRADLQSWWARKRGKDDPNTMIGTDLSTVGESFYALDNINLEVYKGETLGVIGENGAGKSTLLKILSRITAPTEGTVKVKGRIAGMLEVGTGFHPELTGRENIYMNGAILGMTKAEIDEKLEEIIDFSECRKFIDTPVKRYSSGMYVKLAFSVAAHLDAEIMIMDEVLAVGDMKFQEKCLGKMGDAAGNEGKTVLYVSHNMNTIRKLCNRCIVLSHGKIVFDGGVENAIEKYMDLNNDGFPLFYDLSDIARTAPEFGKEIHIDSLEILNHDTAVFVNQHIIRFRIKWHSERVEEKLELFVPLKYVDGTPVGMAKSDVFSSELGINEKEFAFDVSNLVDGKYYFHIAIFSQNSFGTHRLYDNTSEKKVYFELRDFSSQKTEWYRNNWGSISLNRIHVME